MAKIKRTCVISFCIVSLLLIKATAYILPAESGPVTLQFKIICGLPNALLIEASLLPCQTVIVDSLTLDADSSGNSKIYYLNVPLSIGYDSTGCLKNIVRERTIAVLPQTLFQSPYYHPALKLVIKRGSASDTLSNVPLVDIGLIFMYPPPTCAEAIVNGADSLLQLLKKKYDSSSFVYLLRRVGDGSDNYEVGDDSLGLRSFLPWSRFNRHDEIQQLRYNFQVIERLKGPSSTDSCSFLSGLITHHFISANSGKPIYFNDSSKTQGDDAFISTPLVNTVGLGIYKTWLIFSNDSLHYDRNPGFAYPGNQCPYPLCRESGTYWDTLTQMPAAYPPRIRGIPIPVVNDTVQFNVMSRVSYQLFKDMVKNTQVSFVAQKCDSDRPGVFCRNGRIFLNNGPNPGTHISLSIYTADGKALFCKKDIRASGLADGFRLVPGVYFVRVDVGHRSTFQKVMVAR